MNFEGLIEALSCPLTGAYSLTNKKNLTNKHFLENPKLMPCCSRTACDKCILSYLAQRRTNHNDFILTCPLCQVVSRVSLNGDELNLEFDFLAKNELDKNAIEINHYLIKKLETSVKNIENRFEMKENYLSKRRAYIEHEIHSQVENLKAHLDQLETEMKQSLDQSTTNMKFNLEKFENEHKNELNDLKKSIESLKASSLSYVNTDLNSNKSKQINNQFKSIDKCMSNLNDLNKLSNTFSEMVGELTFDPNIDLPTKTLIGNLKQINNINLKDQFKQIKTQMNISKVRSVNGSQMPISPRYLAACEPNYLFFTDSQTRQIIQLKLDTGDFVKSTNLKGVIKNPDGICLNPSKQHIYVGDSDLKCIFKLDFEFNLLKKFALKDLKWPKGLFYDYESKFLSDNATPDRLYVCDYSNQRVAIFNEQDQLRDFLTISFYDDSVPSFNKNNLPENNFILSEKQQKQINSFQEEYKFCPLNVKVTKTLIYVTDDWTGGNCIRIFDKATHQLVRNVGDLNAWNPLGILIDDVGNIFTIARLYYETGQTNLFCFGRDGELAYKTVLNISSECVTDIAIDKYTDRSSHKIVCSGDKKIHMIQF